MSRTTPSILAADSTGRRDNVPPTPAARAWTFWLPFTVMWLAMYSVEHSTYFASPEFVVRGDGQSIAEEVGGSSTSRQLGIIALGAAGVLLLVIPSTVPVEPNKGMLVLVMAMGSLLVVSSLWAEDSGVSLKRSVQPILLMVAALGIAKHWRPLQVCRFAALFTGTMLIVGFCAACGMGTFLQGEAYRFGGTLHPNAQAVNCAVLCLASLALFSNTWEIGQFQWRWLFMLVVGLVFLMLTRSRTTTAAFAVGLLVYFYVGASWPRKFVLAAIPTMAAAFCGLMLLIPDSGGGEFIVSAISMGRGDEDTASLSGRLPIWSAVLSDVADRPLFGFGYGGFWTPQRVWEYSFIRHWQFNHAHSAYFETLLNIGCVGLALGLAVVLWTAVMACRRHSQSRDVGYRFISAMIAMAMVHGLIDSNFVMVGFAPLLIMICISALALHRQVACQPEVAAAERPLPRTFRRTALNY
jgi:exopolysaccharide production protein ExoQ